MSTLPQINETIDAIKFEVLQQHMKWGEQNHQYVPTKAEHRALLPREASAKIDCEKARRAGRLTWAHILVEEVAEALEAPNAEEAIAELIQVAAVAISMIDSIKRNGLG